MTALLSFSIRFLRISIGIYMSVQSPTLNPVLRFDRLSALAHVQTANQKTTFPVQKKKNGARNLLPLKNSSGTLYSETTNRE